MKKFSISRNKVVQSMTITAFAISLSAAGAVFAQGGMTGQQGQEQSGMSGQGGSTPGAHPAKPYEKGQGQGSDKKGMKKDTDMDPRGDIKPRPGGGSGYGGGSGGGTGTGGGSGSSSGGSSGTGGGGGY